MMPLWVEHYLGIPYREHGRDRDGIDCWGLFMLVHSEIFGRRLPDFADRYDDDLVSKAGAIDAEARWLSIAITVPTLGDAVFLRLGAVVAHIGLVIGGGRMLHARDGALSCVESYTSGPWSRRIAAFRRP
jgi:cell wall-associated NlpC family hydrolase